MLLTLLLACGSGDDESPVTFADDSAPQCHDPTAQILEPADGQRFELGAVVQFEGVATSSQGGQDQMRLLWAVEDDSIGTGASNVWTADTDGTLLVRFQAEDDCAVVQAQIHIVVDP